MTPKAGVIAAWEYLHFSEWLVMRSAITHDNNHYSGKHGTTTGSGTHRGVWGRVTISGLTSGQSYTYKWAGRCDQNFAGTFVAVGGTEFTGTANYGAASMEVWSA